MVIFHGRFPSTPTHFIQGKVSHCSFGVFSSCWRQSQGSVCSKCFLSMPPVRDPQLESQALDWIEANLGEPLDRKKPYDDLLKDGIILCKLMNKLMPGCIKKIDTKGGGFALMQNIERFQAAAKQWGVPANEVFQTVDLWEKKNIPQVTLCIHAMGRVAQTRPDYKGPILGPKMAEKNERQFTEAQLLEAKNTVSLQYGTNTGANQSGINMGKPRSIMD